MGFSFKLLIILSCNLQKLTVFRHSRNQTNRAGTHFSAQDPDLSNPLHRDAPCWGYGEAQETSSPVFLPEPSVCPSCFSPSQQCQAQSSIPAPRGALPLCSPHRDDAHPPFSACLGHTKGSPRKSSQQLHQEGEAAGGEPTLMTEDSESPLGGSAGVPARPWASTDWPRPLLQQSPVLSFLFFLPRSHGRHLPANDGGRSSVFLSWPQMPLVCTKSALMQQRRKSY